MLLLGRKAFNNLLQFVSTVDKWIVKFQQKKNEKRNRLRFWLSQEVIVMPSSYWFFLTRNIQCTNLKNIQFSSTTELENILIACSILRIALLKKLMKEEAPSFNLKRTTAWTTVLQAKNKGICRLNILSDSICIPANSPCFQVSKFFIKSCGLPVRAPNLPGNTFSNIFH